VDEKTGTDWVSKVEKKTGEIEQARAKAQELMGSTGIDLISGASKLGLSMYGLMHLKLAGTLMGKSLQGGSIGYYFGVTEYKPEEGEGYTFSEAHKRGMESAAFGAAFAPAAGLVSSTYHGAKHLGKKIFGKEGDASGILNKLIPAGKRQRSIDTLKNVESEVPGVKLTAGGAGAGARVTELGALQKIADKKDPSKFLDIAIKQEKLHERAIGKIAGAGGGEKAAKTARDAAAKPYYIEAEKSKAQVEVSETLAKANEYLTENAHLEAVTKPVGTIKKILTAVDKDDNPVVMTVQAMKSLSANIKDKIGTKRVDGTPEYNQTVLRDIKKTLDLEIEKASKSYEKARAIFKEHSASVNQARIGDQLKKALAKPLGDGERRAAFAKIVNDLGKDINPHTGKPFIEALTDGQKKNMYAVLADLKRATIMDRQAKAGMTSVAEKTQAFQLIPLGMLDPRMSVSRVWFNALAGKLNTKGMKFIADNMDNPKLIASLIEKSNLAQEQAIGHIFSKMLAQSLIVANAQREKK